MSFPYKDLDFAERLTYPDLLIVVESGSWIKDLYQRMLSHDILPAVVEDLLIDFTSNIPINVNSLENDVIAYLNRMERAGIKCLLLKEYLINLFKEVIPLIINNPTYSDVTYFEVELLQMDKYLTVLSPYNFT